MQCAFEWTTTTTTRTYLTGTVKITARAVGEEYRLGDNTIEAAARLVELAVELPGILEEQSMSPRNATELWLDLLRAEAITFYPDASTLDSFAIIPDLEHPHTMMSTRYGALQQSRVLRFKSKTLYQPSDPFLDTFAQYITIQ